MTSTNGNWVVINDHGNYWAGDDNFYPDASTAFEYETKQDAKAAYRDVHGTFPRTLDVVELVEVEAEEDEPGTALTLVQGGTDEGDVFDGELVDDNDLTQLAGAANRHYADFQAAGHSALVAAWNCGAALARAKELVGHGEFKPWVDSHFDGSYSLASSYMRIAANVQTSELSQHDSISGVLKAIAEAKKGGRAGTPERDFQARLTGISKASKKLAEAIEAFADDLGSSTEYNSQDWESLTNKAVLPLALALGGLDQLWGVA